MAVDINDSDFEKEVIEKSKTTPVLVDFWAEWCNPCVILKPVLEKLAEEFKEKIILVKINVEKNQENASKYGVMSIPSVKLFKDGKEVDGFIGAQPEEKIREWLEKLINSSA